MSTPPPKFGVRKGSPSPRLGRAEFEKRFLAQFADPMFKALPRELAAIASAAWQAYQQSRKSPNTRKAGPEFADPNYDLSVDWLDAREAIQSAQHTHRTGGEHTCPGEISKSLRLVELACQEIMAASMTVEVLDLSRLNSEYGRNIHPCKGCFSTAPALCHWPCSCYPNYFLGQSQDWMPEVYPMWVRAHGIMMSRQCIGFR